MDLARLIKQRRERAAAAVARLEGRLRDLTERERRTRARLAALGRRREEIREELDRVRRRAAREERLVVRRFLAAARADLERRGAWGKELPLVAALLRAGEEAAVRFVLPVPPAVLGEASWEGYAGTALLRAGLIAWGTLVKLALERRLDRRPRREVWEGFLALTLPLGRLPEGEARELRETDLEVLLAEATPPAWGGSDRSRRPVLHWVEPRLLAEGGASCP